jgi:hypothetical protein
MADPLLHPFVDEHRTKGRLNIFDRPTGQAFTQKIALHEAYATSKSGL